MSKPTYKKLASVAAPEETEEVVKAKPPVSVLGPKRGYVDLVDDALKAEAEKEAAGPRLWNPLRPSNAGKCPRKLAYELAEYRLGWQYEREVLKPTTKRIFALGHSIEWNTIRDFQKVPGFQVKYRQQVVDNFTVARGKPDLPPERLEGSMDWVLWSDEHRCIFDAKSRKEKHFDKWNTNWKSELRALKQMDSVHVLTAQAVWIDDLEAFLNELGWCETLSENLLQLNFYACSDFCTSRGITHGAVHRVNKNTSEHYEVRFCPSKAVLAATQAKFDMVSVAVDLERPESVPPQHAEWTFCNCATMKRLK